MIIVVPSQEVQWGLLCRYRDGLRPLLYVPLTEINSAWLGGKT